MVLEFLSVINLVLNDFFAQHIVFVSNVLAAVFLILTETTINMRIITPILDNMENMIFGKIPLLPNIITTILFIIWASVSIYIYQFIFQVVLSNYKNYLTVILIAAFFLITIAVNIKYRD